jgi:lipid II:glycine glycyltransferase (peptidoglycan interpeptide bridge formation enzyme)
LDYYRRVWDIFRQRDAAGLFLAEYQGQPLAALMVLTWGKRAYYMYGASSNEQRHRMPTYLVQFRAMQWAREQGCESYDLWGIPDLDRSSIGPDMADAEQRGALSTGMGGLYRFKRGFGGHEVRYVGTYEYVYNAVLCPMLHAVWQRRSQ